MSAGDERDFFDDADEIDRIIAESEKPIESKQMPSGNGVHAALEKPTTFLLDSGVLFEINRAILHPLGYVLALAEEAEGRFQIRMASALDGWVFEPEDLETGGNKLITFLSCPANLERFAARKKSLGYLVQGVPAQARTLAEIAYNAYGENVGWLNYAGLAMPSWDLLTEKIRGAWTAAVQAVVESGGGP